MIVQADFAYRNEPLRILRLFEDHVQLLLPVFADRTRIQTEHGEHYSWVLLADPEHPRPVVAVYIGMEHTGHSRLYRAADHLLPLTLVGFVAWVAMCIDKFHQYKFSKNLWTALTFVFDAVFRFFGAEWPVSHSGLVFPSVSATWYPLQSGLWGTFFVLFVALHPLKGPSATPTPAQKCL